MSPDDLIALSFGKQIISKGVLDFQENCEQRTRQTKSNSRATERPGVIKEIGSGGIKTR